MFPFLFFNDGPTPIIVQNLRLLLKDEEEQRPLTFMAFLQNMGSSEGRSFATQFPIRAREVESMICEFQREPSNITFEIKSYPVELQAQLDSSKQWKCICHFLLNISSPITNAGIVRDNMTVD